MKRKSCYIFVSLLLTVLLCGCEKELDFNQEEYSGMSVFALAAPGQPFSLRLSQSFTVNSNPSYVFSTDYRYYYELDSIYLASIVIPDAEVVVTVNGTRHYNMKYNAIEWPYAYESDYVPEIGDHIEILAKADGFPDVTAAQDITEPTRIEVLSTEVKYNKQEIPQGINVDDTYIAEDSVMEIKLRIHDNGSRRDYYRLNITGIAESDADYYHYYSISDIFTSNDVIFSDYQLTKPYGEWPAKFSNVFDDHIFNGEDYDVTVQTRKRLGDNPRVIISLQSISQDLYFFLKSHMIFRLSTDDVYTTPIGLHSNINNGFGIFGSLSYDRHIIYY